MNVEFVHHPDDLSAVHDVLIDLEFIQFTEARPWFGNDEQLDRRGDDRRTVQHKRADVVKCLQRFGQIAPLRFGQFTLPEQISDVGPVAGRNAFDRAGEFVLQLIDRIVELFLLPVTDPFVLQQVDHHRTIAIVKNGVGIDQALLLAIGPLHGKAGRYNAIFGHRGNALVALFGVAVVRIDKFVFQVAILAAKIFEHFARRSLQTFETGRKFSFQQYPYEHRIVHLIEQIAGGIGKGETLVFRQIEVRISDVAQDIRQQGDAENEREVEQ